MPDLKLACIPNRTPVKLTIAIHPDLHQALLDYAHLYAQSYGRKEPLGDLIAAMLAAFLESDRAFKRARRAEARP
jgi:hypothetical protein